MSQHQRAKYISEKEETQYKSKRSKGDFEHDTTSPQSHRLRTPLASSHGSGYEAKSIGTNIPLGVEPYQISLTTGVWMMWIQKFIDFSRHVRYHSMFFAHLIGMKWFPPLMMPPKDTRALGMTRLEPWDLIMKKKK